ncbi:RidA family protein [Actinomycetospora termitidis]|uniref:RidA family protein n=1 Tax=Actinomycetospora termitidis TaxID=3053470 RepID=A0ABT7M398_9PSEU|nr:RidA family protein [Actinomycetospora sp. Odt1-22]MDL5155135.1 RidA family protein [Actinomycetospora sp. Odt1-22]
MDQRVINPWEWSIAYGFQQAVEVTGEQRTLYCSGQTSVDKDGHPQHEGDMTAQAHLALDNLETVLGDAGMSPENIVRLNVYTTDVDAFFGASESLGERMGRTGYVVTMTLLGVARLAFPELLLEIEATAVA